MSEIHKYYTTSKSPKMKKVWEKVEKLAPKNVMVLIRGKTGVGKEVIAQAIHEWSPRKNRAPKAVNCGAFYQDLLQSELFGHERGSFTGATSQRRGVFEQADGGTLFLDEVGEMSPEVQVKFLRVLDEQKFTRLGGEKEIKVDVRIILATNADLEQAVKLGKFRVDLYSRITGEVIRVPPLSDRREDIPGLVKKFIDESNEKHGLKKTMLDEALEALKNADWEGNIEGNVRTLKQIVESVMIRTEAPEITQAHIEAKLQEVRFEKHFRDTNNTRETEFGLEKREDPRGGSSIIEPGREMPGTVPPEIQELTNDIEYINRTHHKIYQILCQLNEKETEKCNTPADRRRMISLALFYMRENDERLEGMKDQDAVDFLELSRNDYGVDKYNINIYRTHKSKKFTKEDFDKEKEFEKIKEELLSETD